MFFNFSAISEECSDDLLASSATSSPPNGFMAPLKKRRVVRQCSDLNAEDIPSPKEDIKDLLLEEGMIACLNIFKISLSTLVLEYEITEVSIKLNDFDAI